MANKTQFSKGQTVVMTRSGKNVLGTIERHYPGGFYDVKGEDGKTYEQVPLDQSKTLAISLEKTAVYYAANGISKANLPDVGTVRMLKTKVAKTVPNETEEDVVLARPESVLTDLDEEAFEFGLE